MLREKLRGVFGRHSAQAVNTAILTLDVPLGVTVFALPATFVLPKNCSVIEIARTDVSRDSIAEGLDKGSQAEAIHTTTREKYENVVKLLRDSGVQVFG